MLAEPAEMARFNAWANARLHACAAILPAEEISRDRDAFFGSILGTFNHILLVDILYRERLQGRETRFKTLDETVHGELAALSAAQAAEDAYYVDYFTRLDPTVTETTISFTTLTDEPLRWEVPRKIYFSNLFQHQIHHRGQAHNMLSQAGLEPPSVGFIEYQVEEGLEGPG